MVLNCHPEPYRNRWGEPNPAWCLDSAPWSALKRARAATVSAQAPRQPLGTGIAPHDLRFTWRPPVTVPPRFTGRKTCPLATADAQVQVSMATFTHAGIGAVQTRPCFPTRSTRHQRPSRC
jgi:hypothetical protein